MIENKLSKYQNCKNNTEFLTLFIDELNTIEDVPVNDCIKSNVQMLF